MPSPAEWMEAKTNIPSLEKHSVVRVIFYVSHEKQVEIREVESVSENTDGWNKVVEFLDGSYIRQSSKGRWGFVDIYNTARPLRGIEVLSEEEQKTL